MEPTVEIVPAPRLRFQPRVVGPGRKEREYLERIARGEERLAAAQAEAQHRARELETAERLERACQRRIDRLEHDVAAERERMASSETAQKRLLLALGAVQRENELLRARVEALSAPPAPALPAPRSARRGRSWLDWLRTSRPRA